jgi:hypothetical protein
MLGSLFPVQSTIQKVGFEDVKQAINHQANTLLINTLPVTEQAVLIPTTLPYEKEEATLNAMLSNYDTGTYTIIVYGKHTVDDTPEKKYRQLKQLGFSNVFVYVGGRFEWILLQDIFGAAHFPTTSIPNKDLLVYAPLRGTKITTPTPTLPNNNDTISRIGWWS